MSRFAAALGGALVTAVGFCAFGAPVVFTAGSLVGGELKNPIAPAACGSEATIQQVSRQTPKVAGFDATQVGHAATIAATGQEMKVPPRGWVVAVATALQESTLRNLANTGVPSSMRLPNDGAGHDHDSVGLFQQRPNPPEGAGSWGTVKELMTPQVSARKFYTALLRVSGWQAMSLTKAAQTVQGSAYPSAYAKWEDEASRLVDAVSGGAAKTPVTAANAGTCARTDEVTSSGWVRPVPAPVGSAFRSASRPDHYGVDLSAARGVPVRAAAAGTVVYSGCNTSGSSCDVDGSPSVSGCGWYLDIRHAGKIVTRYCHLLRQPLVATGAQVTAGQELGVVGSSGNSSGPHLHFEVHTNDNRSNGGAIDPVKFMADRGAPLGAGNAGSRA